jgi:hypothetical protein
MNSEECERKRSGRISRHDTGIRLNGLRKTRKSPSGLSALGRILNWNSFSRPQLTSLIEALMSETQSEAL